MPSSAHMPHLSPTVFQQNMGGFDIFRWHPNYQSCLRYFLQYGQFDDSVQVMASFVNILLPFQRVPYGRTSPSDQHMSGDALSNHNQQEFHGSTNGSGNSSNSNNNSNNNSNSNHNNSNHNNSNHNNSNHNNSNNNNINNDTNSSSSSSSSSSNNDTSNNARNTNNFGSFNNFNISTNNSIRDNTLLNPYIRRLVATGLDAPAVLHNFFGEDWVAGVGPLRETERRNYLFAAKSDNWLRVKTSYDMEDGQAIPFLRPLQDVSEDEIQAAETSWSDWLAMGDWMLGPRAPQTRQRHGEATLKMEDE